MSKLSKLQIIFISLFFSTISILVACSSEYFGNFMFIFTPEIIEREKEKPLFYSSDYSLYDSFYTEYNSKHSDVNTFEWEVFFKKSIPKAVIKFWLYESNLKQINEEIFFIREGKERKDKKLENFSINKIPKEDSISFLFYLGFAKRNEKFSTKEISNYWEEKKEENHEPEIKKQIEGGLRLFQNENSSFVKERYIFQITRLYYFQKKFDEAISFYEKNKNLFSTKNSIQGRALGYVAGSYFQKKDFVMANYLYSKVFSTNPESREMVILSFRIKDESEWKKVFSLAKTNEEKTSLWFLFGYKLEGLKALKEIYKLDSNSIFLEVLLTREINKKEYFILNDDKDDENSKKQKSELIELTDFVLKVANEKVNHFAWNLSAFYLLFSTGKWKEGKEYLIKSEKLSKKNALFEAQFRLIKIFSEIVSNEKITNEIENSIFNDVKFIYSEKATEIKFFRYSYAREWIQNSLAKKFVNQNELEKSEIIKFGINKNHFKKIENLQKMINYLDKKKFSNLEEFYYKNNFNKSDFRKELARKHILNENFELALEELKKIPKNEIKNLTTDPLKVNKKDCKSCDLLKKPIYNEISFLEKLIDLKKQITHRKNISENYQLLGNAFYNLSYFGTSEKNKNSFYSKINSWVEPWEFKYINFNLKEDKEFDPNLAKKYYTFSLDTSIEKEQKVKNLFYISKCELNEWYLSKEDNEKRDFVAPRSFAKIKDEFADTKFYSEIINECGYFRKFNK